jgi:hypothetical protein
MRFIVGQWMLVLVRANDWPDFWRTRLEFQKSLCGRMFRALAILKRMAMLAQLALPRFGGQRWG